jgi:hypothetical protein
MSIGSSPSKNCSQSNYLSRLNKFWGQEFKNSHSLVEIRRTNKVLINT